MKKIFVLSVLTTITSVAFADTGTAGISDAADGVVTYMPYVRALCYAVAAIIAVVGAVAVYYTMQTNPQNTAKRISMTVGSALTLVCLSLALPQFFGVDGSVSGGSSSSTGSSTSGTSGSSNGFLASDKGGISQSGIITTVPTLADRNWVHFPNGTKMETANFLLDIYTKNGGGSQGSYGRTLDYINKLYWNQEINTDTYNALMSASGNLPHN
jgi:hypothetical protein